jgi:hypothetical protein
MAMEDATSNTLAMGKVAQSRLRAAQENNPKPRKINEHHESAAWVERSSPATRKHHGSGAEKKAEDDRSWGHAPSKCGQYPGSDKGRPMCYLLRHD